MAKDTYATIDPARITWMRKAKKVMLAAAQSYGKDNLAFVTRVKRFAARIPHRTSDFFKWSEHSPMGFDVMYDEILNEYNHLHEWSTKLFKVTQNEGQVDLADYLPDLPPVSASDDTPMAAEPDETPAAESETGKKLGRPTIGVKRKVSVNLDADLWAYIDEMIKRGEVSGYSEFFRRAASDWIGPNV